MRHQDIQFVVVYQKGKLNQIDFMSRRAKPISLIPREEQQEAADVNNLLYMLHTTPIMDHIGLTNIAKSTKSDPTLQELCKSVRK